MRLPVSRILAGDCREVLPGLPAESVDLVFADPPYNLSGRDLACIGNRTGGDWHKVNERWDRMEPAEYRRFTRAWLGECRRVLAPTGSLYVCATLHNLGDVLTALADLELPVKNLITWHKTNAMPSMTRRLFKHASEHVVFAVRGPGYVFNHDELKALNPERRKDTGGPKQLSDVWSLPLVQGPERLRNSDGRAAHPTQKPETLLERCIVASTEPGQVVLDPFLGSGTTAAVARRLGRRWIGIERDPAYRKMARERLRQVP